MSSKLKMRMAAITNDPLYPLACKDLAALSNQLVAQKETCDSMMFIQLVLTDLIRARFGDADAKANTLQALQDKVGMMRGEICRRLRLRFAPEMQIFLDESSLRFPHRRDR